MNTELEEVSKVAETHLECMYAMETHNSALVACYPLKTDLRPTDPLRLGPIRMKQMHGNN
jgi:hypothetical protein